MLARSLKKHAFLMLALLVLASGLSLRLASVSWNSRLFGDVNLFALTAREYARSGRLDYPMKYEFSDQVEYLTLHSPASQHPPLWSILAGMLAKALGSDNTFALLKSLGLVTGMALVGGVLLVGYRNTWREEALTAAFLMALSPVLVDFSANGSMYVASALLLLVFSHLLAERYKISISYWLLAGICCALGILIHSSLLLMPIIFVAGILWQKPEPPPARMFPVARSKLKCITRRRFLWLLVFCIAVLLPLLPWLVWNLNNFGRLWYSYSSYYVLNRLGMTQTAIYGDIITTRPAAVLDIGVVSSYLVLALKAGVAFTRQAFHWMGPFALVLAAIGALRLWLEDKTRLFTILLPAAVYSATIFLWATYKFRFLVPLLPAVYLLSAYGFGFLYHLPGKRKWLAWLALAGMVGGMLPTYLDSPGGLYAGNETRAQAKLYDQMQPLALELAQREAGVVLGMAQGLDGGIETVYWQRFPFVAGRDLDPQALVKLVNDFHVRYLWSDEATNAPLLDTFPAAILILESAPFYVYELPPQPACTVCPARIIR